MTTKSKTGYLMKRSLDIVLAGAALLMLSPLLFFLAGLVRWKLGRPVLFRQERLGYQGRPTWVLKFRTMTDERDEEGHLLPDEQRLTRQGRFLRRTSLDELPQLINVLIGHISLVGPRPIPLGHRHMLNAQTFRRLNVKPGLTGWAQIHYRGQHRTWEEKFDLDLYYVEHQSLLLDLYIIFLTIKALVVRFIHNKSGESLGPQQASLTSNMS